MADLRLGYTEAPGHPLLRAEIATLYESITPDEVLVFSGAEEAIFIAANVILRPGDHAIVAWPADQSLHEVARAVGADVTLHELRSENGGGFDLDRLREQVTPRTRLIVINVPNNPTGSIPDPATYRAIADIAADAGATLLVDEVYRFLEHDGLALLPAGADVGPHGVSLGVMSKSFALAGLRIGWLATHDARLLDRATRFKDYTTICASAPAEILALVALRARDRALARSRGIVDANLALLDAFFARQAARIGWVRPSGGPVGFPALRTGIPVDRFAQDLLESEGVLIAPGFHLRPPRPPLQAGLRTRGHARGARGARAIPRAWRGGRSLTTPLTGPRSGDHRPLEPDGPALRGRWSRRAFSRCAFCTES